MSEDRSKIYYTRSRIVIRYEVDGEESEKEYLIKPECSFDDARNTVAILNRNLNGVFKARLIWEE
jgi:hypothetical protein